MAGCGSDSKAGGSNGSPSSGGSAPEQTASSEADPDAALKQAVAAWEEAGFGTFRFKATFGRLRFTSTGSYDLPADSWTIQARSTTGSKVSEAVDLVTIGDKTWSFLRHLAAWQCWAFRASGFEVERSAGSSGSLPLSLHVPRRAQGQSVVEGEVVGLAPLGPVVGQTGQIMMDVLGVTSDEDAPVVVRFQVDGGRLAGWRTNMTEVFAAMRKAGLAIPSSIAEFAADEQATDRAEFSLRLEEGSGVKEEIAPPPAEQVVAFHPMDTFNARMEACGDR